MRKTRSMDVDTDAADPPPVSASASVHSVPSQHDDDENSSSGRSSPLDPNLEEKAARASVTRELEAEMLRVIEQREPEPQGTVEVDGTVAVPPLDLLLDTIGRRIVLCNEAGVAVRAGRVMDIGSGGRLKVNFQGTILETLTLHKERFILERRVVWYQRRGESSWKLAVELLYGAWNAPIFARQAAGESVIRMPSGTLWAPSECRVRVFEDVPGSVDLVDGDEFSRQFNGALAESRFIQAARLRAMGTDVPLEVPNPDGEGMLGGDLLCRRWLVLRVDGLRRLVWVAAYSVATGRHCVVCPDYCAPSHRVVWTTLGRFDVQVLPRSGPTALHPFLPKPDELRAFLAPDRFPWLVRRRLAAAARAAGQEAEIKVWGAAAPSWISWEPPARVVSTTEALQDRGAVPYPTHERVPETPTPLPVKEPTSEAPSGFLEPVGLPPPLSTRRPIPRASEVDEERILTETTLSFGKSPEKSFGKSPEKSFGAATPEKSFGAASQNAPQKSVPPYNRDPTVPPDTMEVAQPVPLLPPPPPLHPSWRPAHAAMCRPYPLQCSVSGAVSGLIGIDPRGSAASVPAADAAEALERVRRHEWAPGVFGEQDGYTGLGLGWVMEPGTSEDLDWAKETEWLSDAPMPRQQPPRSTGPPVDSRNRALRPPGAFRWTPPVAPREMGAAPSATPSPAATLLTRCARCPLATLPQCLDVAHTPQWWLRAGPLAPFAPTQLCGLPTLLPYGDAKQVAISAANSAAGLAGKTSTMDPTTPTPSPIQQPPVPDSPSPPSEGEESPFEPHEAAAPTPKPKPKPKPKPTPKSKSKRIEPGIGALDISSRTRNADKRPKKSYAAPSSSSSSSTKKSSKTSSSSASSPSKRTSFSESLAGAKRSRASDGPQSYRLALVASAAWEGLAQLRVSEAMLEGDASSCASDPGAGLARLFALMQRRQTGGDARRVHLAADDSAPFLGSTESWNGAAPLCAWGQTRLAWASAAERLGGVIGLRTAAHTARMQARALGLGLEAERRAARAAAVAHVRAAGARAQSDARAMPRVFLAPDVDNSALHTPPPVFRTPRKSIYRSPAPPTSSAAAAASSPSQNTSFATDNAHGLDAEAAGVRLQLPSGALVPAWDGWREGMPRAWDGAVATAVLTGWTCSACGACGSCGAAVAGGAAEEDVCDPLGPAEWTDPTMLRVLHTRLAKLKRSDPSSSKSAEAESSSPSKQSSNPSKPQSVEGVSSSEPPSSSPERKRARVEKEEEEEVDWRRAMEGGQRIARAVSAAVWEWGLDPGVVVDRLRRHRVGRDMRLDVAVTAEGSLWSFNQWAAELAFRLGDTVRVPFEGAGWTTVLVYPHDPAEVVGLSRALVSATDVEMRCASTSGAQQCVVLARGGVMGTASAAAELAGNPKGFELKSPKPPAQPFAQRQSVAVSSFAGLEDLALPERALTAIVRSSGRTSPDRRISTLALRDWAPGNADASSSAAQHISNALAALAPLPREWEAGGAAAAAPVVRGGGTPYAPPPRPVCLCASCTRSFARSEFCPATCQAYANDTTAMVACDLCKMWIFAAADHLSEGDIAMLERGNHPHFRRQYACPLCRATLLARVLAGLIREDRSANFLAPVTDDMAPGYSSIITDPMDLSTIASRLARGVYAGAKGPHVFCRDVERICSNALQFNEEGDLLWKDAERFLSVAGRLLRTAFPFIRPVSDAKALLALRPKPPKDGSSSSSAADPTTTTTLATSSPSPSASPTALPPLPTLEERNGLRRRADGSLTWVPNAASALFSPLVASGDAAATDDSAAVLTMPMSLAAAASNVDLCRACGSAGDRKALLICGYCGEATHSQCLEPREQGAFDLLDRTDRRVWVCHSCCLSTRFGTQDAAFVTVQTVAGLVRRAMAIPNGAHKPPDSFVGFRSRKGSSSDSSSRQTEMPDVDLKGVLRLTNRLARVDKRMTEQVTRDRILIPLLTTIAVRQLLEAAGMSASSSFGCFGPSVIHATKIKELPTVDAVLEDHEVADAAALARAVIIAAQDIRPGSTSITWLRPISSGWSLPETRQAALAAIAPNSGVDLFELLRLAAPAAATLLTYRPSTAAADGSRYLCGVAEPLRAGTLQAMAIVASNAVDEVMETAMSLLARPGVTSTRTFSPHDSDPLELRFDIPRPLRGLASIDSDPYQESPLPKKYSSSSSSSSSSAAAAADGSSSKKDGAEVDESSMASSWSEEPRDGETTVNVPVQMVIDEYLALEAREDLFGEVERDRLANVRTDSSSKSSSHQSSKSASHPSSSSSSSSGGRLAKGRKKVVIPESWPWEMKAAMEDVKREELCSAPAKLMDWAPEMVLSESARTLLLGSPPAVVPRLGPWAPAPLSLKFTLWYIALLTQRLGLETDAGWSSYNSGSGTAAVADEGRNAGVVDLAAEEMPLAALGAPLPSDLADAVRDAMPDAGTHQVAGPYIGIGSARQTVMTSRDRLISTWVSSEQIVAELQESRRRMLILSTIALRRGALGPAGTICPFSPLSPVPDAIGTNVGVPPDPVTAAFNSGADDQKEREPDSQKSTPKKSSTSSSDDSPAPWTDDVLQWSSRAAMAARIVRQLRGHGPAERVLARATAVWGANATYPALRVGAFTVLRWGRMPRPPAAGFVSRTWFAPLGFEARRIWWSPRGGGRRCTYTLQVVDARDVATTLQIANEDVPTACFVITCDEPDPERGHLRALGPTPDCALRALVRVLSARPGLRHLSWSPELGSSSNLSLPQQLLEGASSGVRGPRHVVGRVWAGPEFFGLTLPAVRQTLETAPSAAYVPLYRGATLLAKAVMDVPFCPLIYAQPPVAARLSALRDLTPPPQEPLASSSPSSQTAPLALLTPRSALHSTTETVIVHAQTQESPGKVSFSSNSSLQRRFTAMKREPIRERLVVSRSAIHGWGLFARRKIPKGALVIEYTGEVVRIPVADQREQLYERRKLGGSCYLFRLDDEHIVDATMRGSDARFINHSGRPNCDSRIITVDGVRHIAISALRDIQAGEEVTYNYRFPFEFAREE